MGLVVRLRAVDGPKGSLSAIPDALSRSRGALSPVEVRFAGRDQLVHLVEAGVVVQRVGSARPAFVSLWQQGGW